MRVRPLFPVMAALSALAACGPAPAPIVPTAPYRGEPRPFTRFVEASDGGVLEVLLASYRKGEVEVALLAAVHVADPEYYAAMQQRFEAFDVLLFEMIGDSDLRPHPAMEHSGDDVFTLIQSGMGSSLKLAKQWDCVDYRQPNFVHADMTWEEFEAAMAAAETSVVGDLMSGGLPETDREAESKERKIDLVAAYRGGRGAHELRLLGARLLLAEKSPSEKPTVLIEGRNEKCLAVLREQMLAGKKSFGIFYGAFHMAHLEQRLVRDFGFEKTQEEWITAWDCSASRFPAVEKGLKQKRYRARRDLEKLAAAVAAWQADNPGSKPDWDKVRAAIATGRLPGRADGVDPWQRPYVLRQQGGHSEVLCTASDGREGTADDLVVRVTSGAENPTGPSLLERLADATAPRAGRARREADRVQALTAAKVIQDAVKMYYVSQGRLPSSIEALTEPDAEGRIYLDELPADPWGNAYVLDGGAAREFTVVSLGPDGKKGTADDVSSRDR